MLVVHHPDQALHDPEHVFRMGQFLPQPDRAERYHIFLAQASRHASRIVEAPIGGLEPVLAVHDADYVRFFETAWQRWRAVPGAGPVVARIPPGEASGVAVGAEVEFGVDEAHATLVPDDGKG